MKYEITVATKEQCKECVDLLSIFSARSRAALCRDFDFDCDRLDDQQYINEQIDKVYNANLPKMQKVQSEYAKLWGEEEAGVVREFERIFGEPLQKEKLNVRVWLGNFCPYGQSYFYTSAQYASFDDLKRTIVHETTHIYWWQLWDKVMNIKDKNSPSPAWYQSEIVVQTIADNSPFFSQFVEKNIANNSIFTLKVGDNFVLDEMDKIYKSSASLPDFMKNGYDYVAKNYQEIIDCDAKFGKNKEQTKQ